MGTTRRALLAAGLALPATAGLSAVAGGALAAGPDAADDDGRHGRHRPIWPLSTSEADWAGVASVLGRTGRLMDDGRVYRVGFPRRDLTVTVGGVAIRPALSLGSYAAFARYPGGQTLVMGDLVVTEAELPTVTDTAQGNGLAQTAIHKHLPAHEPQLWWSHIHTLGDAETAARAVRAALDQTGTPGPAPSDTTPGDLDTAALDAIVGRTGAWDGGVYRYTVPRAETITAHRRVLTPGFGVTTVIGFQPSGGGQAAINGDFAMVAEEVQPVIQALRGGSILPVGLHNHALDDHPRLFYMHFWATNDAAALARSLRHALDATHTAP